MFPDLITALLGYSDAIAQAVPATISGYERVPLKGRDYPGVIPSDPSAEVFGLLIPISALSAEDWFILDEYEGDEYILSDVTVTLSASALTITAMTYELVDSSLVVPDSSWDMKQYRLQHLEKSTAFATAFRLEWIEEKRREEISRFFELKKRLKKEWEAYWIGKPVENGLLKDLSRFYPCGPHALVGAGKETIMRLRDEYEISSDSDMDEIIQAVKGKTS